MLQGGGQEASPEGPKLVQSVCDLIIFHLTAEDAWIHLIEVFPQTQPCKYTPRDGDWVELHENYKLGLFSCIKWQFHTVQPNRRLLVESYSNQQEIK